MFCIHALTKSIDTDDEMSQQSQKLTEFLASLDHKIPLVRYWTVSICSCTVFGSFSYSMKERHRQIWATATKAWYSQFSLKGTVFKHKCCRCMMSSQRAQWRGKAGCARIQRKTSDCERLLLPRAVHSHIAESQTNRTYRLKALSDCILRTSMNLLTWIFHDAFLTWIVCLIFRDSQWSSCRQRFVSLAAQKFITSISHDSLQIYKQRRKQTISRLKEQGLKDQKQVLLTEDLAEALQEVRLLLHITFLTIMAICRSITEMHCSSIISLHNQ